MNETIFPVIAKFINCGGDSDNMKLIILFTDINSGIVMYCSGYKWKVGHQSTSWRDLTDNCWKILTSSDDIVSLL